MKRVLILESNQAYAEELSACFAECGYEVCGITGDGEEGAKMLEKSGASVVVVDLLLKTCDGLTVMEGARAHGIKTEFIVLGNFADDTVIGRAIGAGARYYLMKPVSAELVAARADEITAEERPKEERYERRRAGTLDERISSIFISIGIPPHIKGYGYLREGIKLAVEDPKILNNVTKGLYPVIGEKFETSASKVERAIRHAIEVAWNRGRVEAVNAIFGARVYIGTEKPTNSEFIALVADKLLLENIV